MVKTNFPLKEIVSLKGDPNRFFWIDLVAPTEKELNVIGNELGLNKLALEDAYSGRQRPKLEHYDSHLFINAYTARFKRKSKKLASEEIAIFVTENALITVRDDEGFDVKALTKRWDDSIELANHGVSFLLWGLLDVIVDGYFEAVEELDLEIESLEELMFASARIDTAIQQRTYELRKALVLLRRLAVPMREVLNPLVKLDVKFLHNSMYPYYQDVYDHVMRVADWTDSLRDLITTLLETNLTIQGNQMNLIMKKVTSWAAIIAVPTAITGWYGQNIPYLGFEKEWGVWASGGSIILVSGILYFAFKRRDWL
ncbi:MAG: magnesium transporter CorA family protein [Rhodoluna sp.]|nr:magnesium transporter CorA family protein [Rhodoluna sp.]